MRTIVTVAVAVVGIVAGGGCASNPARPSSQILSPPESEPDDMPRGPQLRGLAFEARGADFAAWIDDFEKTVHFNWVPPTYFGYGGAVELEFAVERNGTITSLWTLESSASEPFEEAARQALVRSRLDPLPADFRRLQAVMRVTFVYGPPPGE